MPDMSGGSASGASPCLSGIKRLFALTLRMKPASISLTHGRVIEMGVSRTMKWVQLPRPSVDLPPDAVASADLRKTTTKWFALRWFAMKIPPYGARKR